MPEDTISNWLFAKLSVMCRHSNTSSLVLGVFLSLVSVKWCKKNRKRKGWEGHLYNERHLNKQELLSVIHT